MASVLNSLAMTSKLATKLFERSSKNFVRRHSCGASFDVTIWHPYFEYKEILFLISLSLRDLFEITENCTRKGNSMTRKTNTYKLHMKLALLIYLF